MRARARPESAEQTEPSSSRGQLAHKNGARNGGARDGSPPRWRGMMSRRGGLSNLTRAVGCFTWIAIAPTAPPARTHLTSQMHPMTSRRNVIAPSVAPGQGSFPGTYRSDRVSAACASHSVPPLPPLPPPRSHQLRSVASSYRRHDRKGINRG